MDEATNVALTTSVVLLRHELHDLSARAYLQATDGTIVALASSDTLGVSEDDCVVEIEFLSVEQKLATNTTYTIKYGRGEPLEDASSETYVPTSFTTGDADTKEPVPSEISVDVFHIENSKRCDRPSECPDFLEIKVGSESLSGSPTWSVFSGTAGSAIAPLGAGALGVYDPDQLSPHESFVNVLVPLDQDRCASYRRIDVRGEVIDERKFCEPSKCVRANPEDHFGCGGPFSPLGDAWLDVSEGSCSNPPEAKWNSEKNHWDIDSESGVCSVRGAGLGANGRLWFALLGLVSLVRLTRIRARRRLS